MRYNTTFVLTVLTATVLAAGSAAAQQEQRPAVTLEEAIRLSERVTPGVIQAQGSVRNASAQLRAAYGSFLPSINANSSGGYSFSEGISRTDPITGQVISGNSSSKSLSMGLSASVDLFTGFRRGADIRAAKAQGTAADAGLVNARFQSRLNTTTEFFNALYASHLLAVRRASVRRAEEQLKVSIAKLQNGTATRSDSLRSLVNLGNTRLQLVDAETQLATAEANLGRLIGVDGRVSAVDDSAYYDVIANLNPDEIRQAARDNSPQVQSSEASANAARANLSAAKSAYWPSLSLSGSYNYSGNDRNDYQLFNQRQASIRLSWPLFNGFSRERNITNQSAAFDAAAAQAEDARRQVDAQLTAQLAALDAARQRIDISRISVTAAEEDLRVQQERYRLGVSTIVDLLTSQESLAQAEVDLVNSQFAYLRAKAQIEALIGRSL